MSLKTIISILTILSTTTAVAQTTESTPTVPALNEGWYVQVGLDMTLQHPYDIGLSRQLSDGKKESIFTAGRTQGIVAAIGRWFTPSVGLRARINWENGFPPLSNKEATWLNFMTPTNTPTANADINPTTPVPLNAEHGGYVSMVGDVQLDIQGLFFPYRQDRFWHTQVFPRAGLVYNCALKKGSPLIGLGLGNTFRLSSSINLFFDITYQMVSSGFNGKSTDVGSGANGYLDATIGIQYNLGHKGRTTKKD